MKKTEVGVFIIRAGQQQQQRRRHELSSNTALGVLRIPNVLVSMEAS